MLKIVAGQGVWNACRDSGKGGLGGCSFPANDSQLQSSTSVLVSDNESHSQVGDTDSYHQYRCTSKELQQIVSLIVN